MVFGEREQIDEESTSGSMVIGEIQANTDEQHPNQNVYHGNSNIKCVQLQQI